MKKMRVLQYYLLSLVAIVAYAKGENFGGHSRDFQVLHKGSTVDWNKVLSDLPQENETTTKSRTMSLEDYIESFEDHFNEAKRYLLKKIEEVKPAKLIGRIKSVASIKEKQIRKNKALGNMKDIIGFRITAQTVDDAVKIKELLTKDSIFKAETSVCYGMCGNYPYRSSGYRRIHVIIKIPANNIYRYAEVQIGTPYTDMWADWAHDFIYKGPKKFSQDKDVKKYQLQMAKYFYQLDEKRRILPDCPDILKEADAKQVLTEAVGEEEAEKTYAKLGEPLNACFSWNDMNH